MVGWLINIFIGVETTDQIWVSWRTIRRFMDARQLSMADWNYNWWCIMFLKNMVRDGHGTCCWLAMWTVDLDENLLVLLNHEWLWLLWEDRLVPMERANWGRAISFQKAMIMLAWEDCSTWGYKNGVGPMGLPTRIIAAVFTTSNLMASQVLQRQGSPHVISRDSNWHGASRFSRCLSIKSPPSCKSTPAPWRRQHVIAMPLDPSSLQRATESSVDTDSRELGCT